MSVPASLVGMVCRCKNDCKEWERVVLAERRYEDAVAEYVAAKKAHRAHAEQLARSSE